VLFVCDVARIPTQADGFAVVETHDGEAVGLEALNHGDDKSSAWGE
jgi:hypothetical protein